MKSDTPGPASAPGEERQWLLQLQPKPGSGRQIQQDVIDQSISAARLKPTVWRRGQDGVVTLTGWVDSYSKKWAAKKLRNASMDRTF